MIFICEVDLLSAWVVFSLLCFLVLIELYNLWIETQFTRILYNAHKKVFKQASYRSHHLEMLCHVLVFYLEQIWVSRLRNMHSVRQHCSSDPWLGVEEAKPPLPPETFWRSPPWNKFFLGRNVSDIVTIGYSFEKMCSSQKTLRPLFSQAAHWPAVANSFCGSTSFETMKERTRFQKYLSFWLASICCFVLCTKNLKHERLL